MKRTQDPSVKILRQALDAQHVEGLEAALADLAQRFDLNSVDLANQVLEFPTAVPVFSHVIMRTGGLPVDADYLTVEQGTGLLRALMAHGADLRQKVTIHEISYDPMSLLVASLPKKVRGEDFEPLARFLVEEANVPLEPV